MARMQVDDHGAPIAAAPAVESAGAKAGCSFLLAATVALLLARIPILFVRAFDNDEFEHTHAAWSVFRGLLPYKDFFEHHTPWYYFALSPFFRWFAVDRSFDAARHFLIFGRFVSLALTAVSVILIFVVGRLGATRRVALLGALFLAGQPILIHKTLEIRPDVPALTFFVAALGLLRHGLLVEQATRGRTLRWFLGGGLCLGAAIMCTQKLLFALPGVLVGLGLWTLAGDRRGRLTRISAVLVLLSGVGLPGLVTWIAFARHGAGTQFIYDNFILNAHWKWHSGRHLLKVVTSSGPILLLCLVGARFALSRPTRVEKLMSGDVLCLCTLAGLVAGLLVVPAAYEQYYLPLLAIASLFAARGLSVLLDLRRKREARPGRLLVYATLVFLIWPAVDLARALGRRNDVQMARLQFVFAHTGPSDPVLDGWLGMDVFRPQPLYYSFMHRELQVTLSEREKDAYVDALTTGKVRPALIALDDELRALGPRLVSYVERNYVSSDGVLYLPVQPASPARASTTP